MLCTSPNAAQRLEAARAFLAALPARSEALILAPSPAAALWLVASTLAPGSARFAWRRRTLDSLAHEVALPALARAGATPVRGLGLEALCARVIHELGSARGLGRFQVLRDRPSFVRTLTATLDELRLTGTDPLQLAELDRDLAHILDAYSAALERAALADRASVLAAATQRLREAAAPGADAIPASGSACPLLALDVPLLHACEASFVRALGELAPSACVTVPLGDPRSHQSWRAALGDTVHERALEPSATHDLARLQKHLFSSTPPSAAALGEPARVAIVSSPGESREAVEVARGILEAAARGVPFDRMAVAVRAVENYRAVLEEALARAQLPAHFADGVRRPAPQGRAFKALLACASEGLSARSFAEYLSLAVVPDPASVAEEPRNVADYVPPDVVPDSQPGVLRAAAEDVENATRAADSEQAVPGTAFSDGAQTAGAARGDAARFVSPRRWERLLVDAAVVGGRARWARRLRGLARSLQDQRAALDADDPRRDRLAIDLRMLAELERFASPVLDALERLPLHGSWAQWLTALDALARLALQEPESVCELLVELAPLGPIGPVSIDEVRRLLGPRLSSSIVRSTGSGAGKVFVAAVDELRGRSFDLVFVIGLAEKVFPQRISQDPLLPDRVRQALVPAPALTEERVARERLALRLAVGAASERVVLSFPRFDVEHGRPRVPSFYGLEALQAIHGTLPAFDELTRRADTGAAPRMGWPAPRDAARAIDHAEYDLAILDRWRNPGQDRAGAARYLLQANVHLARALRFRWFRWQSGRFGAADGFVVTDDSVRALLARHALGARPYSATSLANFAACPYKFYLHALARVSEREDIAEVEELDARQRGVLFHAIARSVVEALLGAKLLPLTPEHWPAAQEILRQSFADLLASTREQYAPAIDSVFDAALTSLRADLEGWLRGMLEQSQWLPQHTELVIDAQLECGLRLSGAIDLVEQRSTRDSAGRWVLRATDYKTGALPERLGTTDGGRSLQPLLYALALERTFPEASVSSGRLYFATSAAKFAAHEVALNESARTAATRFVSALARMLDAGFLPAAPDRGECERCAYRVICGPYEEERIARVKQKDAARLEPLHDVRRLA